MSHTPVQEPPAQELSSGSGQTLPSRLLQPISDPSASKRVCFYKSGDYKFSGHRMVINARTFKTFDGLLDALAKKVPLPFGVRTITTPRGTNLVKALDDLHDGGSYVCSDNKRVKPLNLDEVNRRQVPWNATRPLSVRRRRRQGPQFVPFGRRNEVITGRPAKITERGAVRTPKRLVVIRNRDPTVKRTIVLQRRTAPTFDALLDYLSQILQFPVLKLFSMDGRRIDGLAGLILCSGVVVAAGNEPFRLGNYNFHGASQMAQVLDIMEPSMLQPKTQNNTSLSSGRGSRNFSLSSEKYIVNQIKKSKNGSTNSHLHHHSGSLETQVNHRAASLQSCGSGRLDNEHHACIVPRDDDIEKSFCVNQDGSMTVEMKVRLTIKEEEMLHWTTTLSRSSRSKGTVCASISESDNSSPDSNNTIAKDSSSASEDETREENHPVGPGKGVDFHDQQAYEGDNSMASGKAQTGFKRAPTPGPRHVTKKASVESVKTLTESGVQESTLGHYSYKERTADGEKTEGYCIVRHSSNKPIPKPRKTASAGASNKGSHSSTRSSGVAEVLQIQNNGMEVTETVMHIYESQGCYDNYFANEEHSADSAPLHGSTSATESQPSTESGPRSSKNDCDIDLSWQPPTTHSQQRQKEEMLSLSSEPITPTHAITATNSQIQETVKKDKTPKSETKKKTIKPARNKEGLTSTSSSDKKQKQSILSPPKYSKHSSTDKLSSNASAGKKTLTSSESTKSGQKSRGAEKPQIKKAIEDEKMPRKEQALLNVRNTPPKRLNMGKPAAKDNGHNVNSSTGRPQMKKNLSDILQPKKSLLPGKKTISKPKSMTESRIPSPKKSLELSESSMPSLNPSPSEIHQYVENWLEHVSPDQVPYTMEAIADQSQPPTKVVFKIGGDSESDEKSECQTQPDEYYLSPGDAIKKSASAGRCLEATALLHGDQFARGLCISMPSVRVDPVQQEDRLRPRTSAEAIGPADNGSPPSTSNVLIPRASTSHVLHELYSSIHCIRSACEDNRTSNLEKSNSLPNISTQVASAFGSSCKAFMSFLSVMTLRDNLTGSAPGDDNQSEAMLMMESLQKMSAIEDEEELRASLTDLQSRASSRFRERWNDFQILRERLESEPLSPTFSETEFALDVVSEGGDAFENIEELMDELNMPHDLRAEISSTVQQAKHFYPVEESTFVETERNQSDSEDGLEHFVEECNNETKQSPGSDTTSIAEDITQTQQGYDNGEIDQLEKMQSVYFKSDQEPNNEPEISLTDRDETLTDKENEKEEEEQVKEVMDVGNDREDGLTKDTADDGEEKGESEEGAVTVMDDMEQEKWEVEKVSVEKEDSDQEVEEGTGDEMTVDEEEDGENIEEAKEVLMEEVQEARVDHSLEETDEREGDEETEEEEADECEKGEEEKRQWDGIEEGAVEVIEESDEGEEEENIIEEMEEEEEDEADEFIGETDEGEEVGNMKVDEEEEADEAMGETDGEEVGTIIEEAEKEEEEEEKEADAFTEYVEEEAEEDFEEEGDMKEVIEDKGEEEDVENTRKKTEVASEDNNEEEEESEQEVVEDGEDGEDVEVINTEDEEDEGEETDKNMEEEEKCDECEESRKEPEQTVNTLEEESAGEKKVEEKIEENMKTGKMLDDKEREDDSENGSNELNEGLDEMEEQESKGELEEEHASEDADSITGGTDCKNLLEEALYLQQQSSCDEANAKVAEQNTESPTKYSTECQCEDDKGNGTDTVNGFETDEGEEPHEDGSGILQHPVEISQELLDFVNSALQSSSLIFTYDARGNVRIEPDTARVTQNKQYVIPKSRKDISYGLKRLPSPNTSGLSDYRPETSESGGYKTQESLDIVTDSGEEASPVCRGKTDIPFRRTNVERTDSKPSDARNTDVLEKSRLKSGGSFSSYDSGTKASKEDLSYFSAASSQKADTEPAAEATQCISFPPEKDSADGVLIDQGRWLLKENHLIRKSPPVSQGMYGHLDSTSVDTGQENNSEDSLSHCNTQNNPLAAISSSELEEMAKPQTPKCTYYNMPHGSDSDPFLDDSSVKSGKGDASRVRGKGFRVSPTIDTSKTWTNKNGSLSSFASVEFKMQDRKVHPEGESSAVTRARWTSGGERGVLQAQDTRDTLRVRCSQYCPIL
ncbi:oxygen-regulated protein 1 [Cyclopterus lumpus]|uniref:oxygen-regulated protein 1 n=1 Tax=Cyclopterus lumpus TaxID=8103 RepID=UPI001486AB99|nr:oxygen-regulated protein 1 [Cyclopterus lumpus]